MFNFGSASKQFKSKLTKLKLPSGNKPPDDSFMQHLLHIWWSGASDQGESVPVDPSRSEFLRPSALPFCPLRTGYIRITDGIETERHRSFNENFYTDIGHAVHELLQNFVGRMKVEHGVDTQIDTLGNWKCPKCQKQRYFTTYKKCKCGGRPSYQEIEIKWRETIGDIDKVIRIGNMLFILDYKTTGVKAIYKHRDAKKAGGFYLPYPTNRAQITRYTGLFEKVFAEEFKPGGRFEGCTVMGSILAYVSRESLYIREFVYLPASAKTKEKQYRRACRDDKDFVVMKKAVATRSKELFIELIGKKRCKDRDDYDQNYHDPFNVCPLHTVCFNSKRLKATVMEALDAGPSSKKPKKKRR